MLSILLLILTFVSLVAAGKSEYRQPACYAPRKCYKSNYLARNREVYGPVPVCFGHAYSWNDARKQCKDLDLRLCSSMDICRSSAAARDPAFEPYPGSVMSPVIDRYNEWVQIGDDVAPGHPDICKRYIEDRFRKSNGPTEGTTDNHRSWKGDIYCCPKTKVRAYHMNHHVTWQQASDFCEAQVVDKIYAHYEVAHPEKDEKDYYRLCDSAAICDPYENWLRGPASRKNLQWTPVADTPNEWINADDLDEDFCETYTATHGGENPEWGTDDTCDHEFKGFVYCCRDLRRVVTYHHHTQDENVNDDQAQLDVGDEEHEANRQMGSGRIKKPQLEDRKSDNVYPGATAYIDSL